MENTTQEQVLNLDLSATKKKKVVVDKDENRVFYINTSDLGIYGRLNDGIKKLYGLFSTMRARLSEVAESEGADGANKDENTTEVLNHALTDAMRDTDAEMRSILDAIFDAPVSDNCAPDGYMFDVFEGQLRFEYVITALAKLYENNLNAEFYKMKSRLSSKLPDYVKNGKK